MKTYGGAQLHASAILLQGKRLQYLLDRRPGGLHSRTRRCGGGENFLSPARNRTPAA
jgi:hypothetical protein